MRNFAILLPVGHRSLATAKLGCYTKHCGGLCEMALLVLGIAKNVHDTISRVGIVYEDRLIAYCSGGRCA